MSLSPGRALIAGANERTKSHSLSLTVASTRLQSRYSSSVQKAGWVVVVNDLSLKRRSHRQSMGYTAWKSVCPRLQMESRTNRNQARLNQAT